MHKSKNATYLEFPDAIRKMAKMGAARAGVSMSKYVADLVARNAQETGIAALVEDTMSEGGEVDDA